jgi:ergothioneine biosynthesis protein EgtB
MRGLYLKKMPTTPESTPSAAAVAVAATPTAAPAQRWRKPAALATALVDVRRQTLAVFQAWREALGTPDLAVPYSPERNPPRWELGHIGYFQEYWLGRNSQSGRGVLADPFMQRPASRLTGADTLFDSSRVAHETRWGLPLPGTDRLLAYLADTLAQSTDILAGMPDWGQDPLHGPAYFGWLALVHEMMHLEAARYMLDALGLAADPQMPAGPVGRAAAPPIQLPAGTLLMGSGTDRFAFDNELGAHSVQLQAFEIDAQAVSCAAFAAFVDDGGYQQSRYWTAEGWAWRTKAGLQAPRFWPGKLWASEAPVCRISAHEAQAWCCWAGRSLPTEAQWEYAARIAPASFFWGEVWEWTASAFAPYPGFTAHPYRDYSQPWFGSRRVLRGASFATHPHLVDIRYRNFFTPERNDIHAGFRSCARA